MIEILERKTNCNNELLLFKLKLLPVDETYNGIRCQDLNKLHFYH